ncbi:uncharacterized protein F5147DRAFT_776541 [Suillus discolor]|uniref:Uncharacterized protein n=1 Tax=Suillus discolor TaxID=1912936 RepID=A0A9P7JRF6_9AGAM|nr:uncharacterized protein F5147DRAFT_776541 [Suillus discolor]KAG2101885.1 hypothetical protein F5147DRAFT_776541 [Suillus discolor]
MDQATALQERFGRHSIEYYYEEIMQQSHLLKKTRKVNKWNVFIKQEVQCINSDLPAGEKRHKASELMPNIHTR